MVSGVDVEWGAKFFGKRLEVHSRELKTVFRIKKRSRCWKQTHKPMLPGPAPERMGKANCSFGMTIQAIR